jgi:replicative DNA helicase
MYGAEGRVNDVPPQAPEAEESVLGAMLLNANAIAAVSDILEPQDFYRESHGRIYRAAVDMFGAGDPVDAITLIDALARRGELEGVGGGVRIYELARLVPVTANVKHYAGIVKDAARRRLLIDAGHYISKLGWDGREEDLVGRAEEIVLSLAPHTEHETVHGVTEVVAGFREKMGRSKIIETEGIPAPWDFLGRLRRSRLYILAGYTSHGKSAAAVQFFISACRSGEKVVFVTNEMPEEDLTSRIVSILGVPHHMCESGQVESSYRPTADAALEEIGGWDFKIVDDEAIDLMGLRRHVRLWRPGFLIIDHLHRFDWQERRELERTIKGIKNIASEFSIPVLLLAQLNRTGDHQNPCPRPNLQRLRETSVLEHEADVVWFVWRKLDDYYQPGDFTEFLTAKNRHGALGYQNMDFVPEYVRFDLKPVSLVPAA